MFRYCICIALLLIMVGGCEQPAQPASANNGLTRIIESGDFRLINSSGEPVLLVSGQQITPGEIINEPASIGDRIITPSEYFIAKGMEIGQFKEEIKGYLQLILADKISDILLYKSAKKKLGDNIDESLEKAVESEVRRFTQQFGGDQAKADEVIKLKWHDIESYKKILKSEILKQWYVSSQTNQNNFITYRQLKNKYESMKNENFAITPMIEFQLIDIQPAKLEITDPNKDRYEYAEELANGIYSRLKSGEDFAELAKNYSYGLKKQSGGSWEPMNPDSLAEPYDMIAKAAQNMNIGDISQPIKADSHIFIVKLINKRAAGYEPFEKVQEQVRRAALSEQDESKVLNELNESLVQQMTRDETNLFIDFCLEKLYKQSNKE